MTPPVRLRSDGNRSGRGDGAGQDTLRLLSRERPRLQPQRIAVDGMLERAAEATMVIVLDRYEPKRLQHAVGQRLGGTENFCHTVYGAGLRLERDLNEVAGAK